MNKSLWQFIFGIAAFGLAAFAEYQHIYEGNHAFALVLFLLAVAGWLIAILLKRIDVTTRLQIATIAPPTRRTKSLWVAAIIALVCLTWLFSGSNQFNLANVLGWGSSIAVFLFAFWQPERSRREWRVSPQTVVLAGILLIGVFFYFYNLDGVPAEMTSDHAEKLLDVNDVATGGLRPIFFDRNTGREPIQFYLTAAFIGATGHPIDHMALKLMTATLGVLVIPFTFLLARELFDVQVATLAALFVALSKWPVTIARMGLRFPLTPVFIAPLMYFLFRAFKYQRRNDFLIAGLFLGAGLYGYNAFRIAPVLVGIFAGLWALAMRQFNRRLAINCVLMFGLAFVVFVPLARYASEQPAGFSYRMATRLIGEDGIRIQGNPVEIFGENLVTALAMFNWTGDRAWPNSLGDPALDFISAGLFMLGLMWATYRTLRYREMAYAFVMIGIAILVLPSALSIAFPQENPSVVRVGGAIPFVFIVTALPLAWLGKVVPRKPIAAITIAGILLTAIFVNYQRYFIDFDQSYRQSAWNSSEVAAAIREFTARDGDLEHAWIVSFPHWVDTRNVAIQIGRIDWDNTLLDVSDAKLQTNDSANKLYVLNENDADSLSTLRNIFPDGRTGLYRARTPLHDFRIFFVPGKSTNSN